MFSAIISTALAKIMFAASGFMLASNAMNRIETVLGVPTLKAVENPIIPQGGDVEFKDVSFTYDGAETPALSHVSFAVRQGETVALVGPSGGGKTTAASLVPRFWDVQNGAVKVGGVDVRNIEPKVLMDKVAFVFQNNRLFKASVLDNVRAAKPHATEDEVKRALTLAQCDDIIEKLPDGLNTMLGSEGTYLSGGEQQRIALARAVLKDAEIIVLDEATAFTDPENEALIQKALGVLTKDRTVIMIAHRLSSVVHADNIVVLQDGQVKESGKHEELVKKEGLYSKMWADYNTSVEWKISSAEAK